MIPGRFLISSGKTLKSLSPRIRRLAYLSFSILLGAYLFTCGNHTFSTSSSDRFRQYQTWIQISSEDSPDYGPDQILNILNFIARNFVLPYSKKLMLFGLPSS